MGKLYTVMVTATRYEEVCADDEDEAVSEALYSKYGWREEGWDDFETEITKIEDSSVCEDDEEN